jgi:hypothetical protein
VPGIDLLRGKADGIPMHKSWNDNASFLRSLDIDHMEYASAVEGIAAVADFVADAALHLGLHGWTSMHDLCVQQTSVTPFNGPHLRLSPLKSGLVEFRYVDTGIKNRQWVRTATPDQSVGRFQKLLKQLHWVTITHAAG